eukprot:gene13363-20517_t
MRIAAVTVLVGIVGVVSGISCTSNEECGSAKDACHKAAYCIATECAFIPAPQFTPCGENAVCSTAGVCEADKRSRRTVAPTITTTDNVLKIKATSGVDITLADLAGSSTAKLVAAQKSNDAKFAKIDEVAIETAATLAELGEATKASGLYNLKTLPKCEKKFVGLQRLLTTQLQMCVVDEEETYKFVTVTRWAAKTAKSCKDHVTNANGASLNDGVYTIVAADGKEMDVHCDMNTDGGGWTLVAYAGKINGNKRNTIGANWHPLVDTFGAYNAKSPTNGVPFSQMKSKKFEHIFKDDSWIMVTRTSKKKKVLEFPVARRGSWKRGERMEKIKTLRMGNNQHGDGKIRDYSGKVNVFQGCKHPCYTGYDWNMCGTSDICSSSNCDGCGTWSDNPNSGGGKISHRALLYWETGDSGYAASQWFHGTPMTMHQSPSPRNTIQDIEFYLREA